MSAALKKNAHQGSQNGAIATKGLIRIGFAPALFGWGAINVSSSVNPLDLSLKSRPHLHTLHRIAGWFSGNPPVVLFVALGPRGFRGS